MVAQMARIGLVPGQAFDAGQARVPRRGSDPDGAQARRPGDGPAPQKAEDHATAGSISPKGVGNFGTDYLTRGMANLLGPGWNRPQDAVYPLSQKDAAGDEYDGAKYRYVIRFDKGKLPPAEAFWSLTMYDGDFFFVPNALNRYDLAQRDKLIANADGSVDLYLQAESPGKDKEANWLPAPKGKFVLVMRIYAPRKTAPSILDGSWTPPPVKRVP